MLIFFIIFFILSTFSLNFINLLNDKNKQISSSFYILGSFGTVQLISSFILQFTDINYWMLFIINHIIIILSSLVLIISIIFCVKKHYKKINKELWMLFLKQNFLLFISIIVFLFLSLFVRNHFADTGYYLNISTNFHYNSTLPDFNDSYRYVASYYFYSTMYTSLFLSPAPFFNLITPLSFFIILNSIINDFVDNQFDKQKVSIIIKSLIFIITTLISFYLIPTISSGNLFIQANIILLTILLIVHKRLISIPFLLLTSQFFSITGSIISFIIVASCLIYFLLFKNIKSFIKIILYSSLSLITCSPVIIISLGITHLRLIISILFIILFSITFSIALVLILNKKIKLVLQNKNLYEQYLQKNKTFSFIIIILFWISIILTLVYFSGTYQYKQYYSFIMMIISAVLLGSILTTTSFLYKDSKIQYWFFINSIIVSLLVLLLFITKANNASIWRISFNSLALPLPECSFIITFIICYVIWLFVPKIISFKRWQKINWNKKIFLPLLYAITFLGSVVPIIYAQTNNSPIKIELINFNKDVFRNINIFDKDEINFLIEFNKKNQNKSFASDNMSSMFLTNMKNETVVAIKKIYGDNKIKDNRYWAYNRLNFYNCKIGNDNLNSLTIDEAAKNLNNYLTNMSVDFLILDKKSPYFNNLNLSNIKYYGSEELYKNYQYIIIQK